MTLPLYGPATLGTHDYQPALDAIWVNADSGDDANSGSLARPLRHVRTAMVRAPAGGQVVLRGKPSAVEAIHYLESVDQLWHKPVTIQAAPGERVILDGADERTDWAYHPDRGRWYIDAPIFDHVPNGNIIDPVGRWWASWPEGVWLDELALEMGEPGTMPRDGDEFTVTDGRIWLAVDPAQWRVRVATRSTAINGSLDGTNLDASPLLVVRGIEVWRYGTQSVDRAAIRSYSKGSLIENVTVAYCSAAGISSMRGANQTVRNCAMVGCGQLGHHAYLADGLELEHNIINANNGRRFDTKGEAGGAKAFQSVGVRARHNQVKGNRGHGLWADGRSDYYEWTWNVVDGNQSAGIHNELVKGGRAHGNLCTDNKVGVLCSSSTGFTATHNTCLGNEVDIKVQTDNRPPPEWDQADQTLAANVTSSIIDPAEPPSEACWSALGLPDSAATIAATGWYGESYTPPPQEDPDMPFDPTPLRGQVEVAVDEIDRLEEVITGILGERDKALGDLEQKTSAWAKLKDDNWSLSLNLLKVTQERDGNAKTVTSLHTAVDAITALRDQLAVDRAKALEDLAAAQARIVELERMVRESQELDRVMEATVQKQAARIAELEQLLPRPPAPLILGGSDKLGWPDLKEKMELIPGSFTLFCPGSTFTPLDMQRIQAVLDDGALPSVSVRMGTDADTDINVRMIVEAGLAEAVAGFTIAHEPTTGKGIDPVAFKARYQYANGVLPLSWRLGPVFRRDDFMADPRAARYIRNWLADVAIYDFIGVDLYDRHQSIGHTFENLVTAMVPGWFSVESMLRSLNQDRAAAAGPLRLWVRETSCPEDGDFGRPPGWKAQWYRDMYEYCAAHPDVYELVNTFNSDEGDEGAVPPKGWWAWTGTASKASLRECMLRAQLAAQTARSEMRLVA